MIKQIDIHGKTTVQNKINKAVVRVMRSPRQSVVTVCRVTAAVLMLCVAQGCASLVGSVTQNFANDLGTAILESDDPHMVRDGAPAYLILIDSLLAGNASNASLLEQSAELHSAYAGAFVAEPERAKKLHLKAKAQVLQAACLRLQDGCALDQRPYQEFSAWVDAQQTEQVPLLYNVASIWAGWIQANSDDFMAIAELGRVKALMQRVVELDGSYANGNAHLYMGVFETLVPPGMGGRPEKGRQHFEQALDISGGRNLMVKVMYADQYARLMFERKLHDQLLRDVMAADAKAPGLTLMNTVAKERAQLLLETADDYF